nr:MAG TPA: hypothetical protein [Caudoviricetes sp.]
MLNASEANMRAREISKRSQERLEDNQIFAFRKFSQMGNPFVFIAVKHFEQIYLIPYSFFNTSESVKLEEHLLIENWEFVVQ